MKIIDTNTCNAQEAYDGVIQDTMLCAGYMEGTIDACQVSPGIIHNDHIVYYQLLFYVDYQYESNSPLYATCVYKCLINTCWTYSELSTD